MPGSCRGLICRAFTITGPVSFDPKAGIESPMQWQQIPLPEPGSTSSALLWVERVAQAVSEDIEGQNDEKNSKARPNGHPWRVGEKSLGRVEH
jgi:hypothetical protein